jgi:dihydroflavonol-4-reductase
MILVTGATGLVGSHLLLKLLENHPTIHAIYRTESAIEKTKKIFELYGQTAQFENIQWIQADITDVVALSTALENIQQVYHCAALISFDPNDEIALRKTNIEGTANIVNLCIDRKVKKLCFVSSIAALGDRKEHESYINEASEWNPELAHSDYAISKYGAEMEVWRGKQEGLDVIIVNPGVIIGPGFWQSGSGELFSKIKNGLSFYTLGKTGFISVHDVVKCLIFAMENSSAEERYCLVSENLSFESVCKSIALALRVSPPRFYASPRITALAWRLDWLVSVLFSKKRTISKQLAKSLHQHNLYSNEKIKTLYPDSFQSIEECIQENANIYLKEITYRT